MSMPSERISLTSTLNDSGMPASMRVLALDDVLVHLGAAVHVVGLDRQHFLQRVSRAVGFQRPHFHFAEALAAELRLAAQRLLGDERCTGRSNARASCRPPGGAASARACSRRSPGARTASPVRPSYSVPECLAAGPAAAMSGQPASACR
jgi:hypothetical protein